MDLEFGESFRAYASQREELLKVLQTLPFEAWSRGGTVKAGTGRREETVLDYAQRTAQHEAGHCEQIERILSSTPPADHHS